MATTITAGNATNGLAFSADNAGILELKTGTGAGTTAVTISTAQAVTFAGNVSGVLKSGTAVASTSGTSIDFTDIPSTAKRITVMFAGVSTNGTSNIQIQVGTSGTITTSGYAGTVSNQAGSTTANSTGFQVANTVTVADLYWGHIVLTKSGANATQIIQSSTLANSAAANIRYSSGGVTPANVINTVRITTVNGTDTFDAGSINILYE